jgi:hypothetical protein
MLFRPTGRIVRQAETVQVELHPFNDQQLNRDLVVICARVNAASPRQQMGVSSS